MEISGFGELEATLQKALDGSLKLRNQFVSQEAELLISHTKNNTPVDTGTLRNAWKRTRAADGKATVYNNTQYAAHVEFGHRIKTRSGKWSKTPSGKTRFVKGAKMFHRGMQEVQASFQEDAAKIMENLLK